MESKREDIISDLLSRGVRLFPQDRNKKPCVKKWPEVATCDTDVLLEWGKKFPQANWACLCGEASGILVIDIDVKGTDDGLGSWDTLVDGRDLPDTYTVQTPSGGKHIYFQWDDSLDFTKIPDLAPGVEVIGSRQCCTIAGSFYASGASYRLEHDGEFAPAPDWLLTLIKQAKKPKREITDIISPEKTGEIIDANRNVELTAMAGSWRARGYSQSEIVATLQAVNERRCSPPLPTSEVTEIAKSITNYVVGETLFNYTDLGNGERFAHYHGENIRYCYKLNTFLLWTGSLWQTDEAERIIRLAKSTTARMFDEAYALENEKKRKALASFALKTEAKPRLMAMLDFSKHQIAIGHDALDVDPYLLCAQNGTVDLKTGKLRDFSRDDYITRQVSVEYDPEAKAPRWKLFLDEIFAGNTSLVDFVQRIAGYSLTGDTSEQCLFILHGKGSNGKSTLLSTLMSIMGKYSKQIQPEALMVTKKDAGQATPELAALPGVRLLNSVETAENRRLNESLVKQMSGQDQISARKLYAEFFEFVPSFKLWIASNHLPKIQGTDHAIWRRIRTIPFEVQIPDERQDKHLLATLQEESAGILAWLVEGCMAWQSTGLSAPEDVVSATDEYRHDMDGLGDFIDACLERDEGFESPIAQVYEVYVKWCLQNGEKAFAQRTLGTKLRERDFKEKRTMRTRCWENIAICDEWLEE